MKQYGMALVQVLIIATVLGMLGIFISQTVRTQVAVVSGIEQSFSLRLELEQAESELFRAMLSHRRYPEKQSANPIAKQWNFYGKPFALNEMIQVRLIDTSALLSLNTSSTAHIRQTLLNAGIAEGEVRVFIDSLQDWKDEDDLKHLNGAESDYYQQIGGGTARNGYLQSLDEVGIIRGGSSIPRDLLEKLFTVRIQSGFNPLNAPEELLRSMLQNELSVEQVIAAREAGELTPLRFFQLTGVDSDENFSLLTGNQIRIEILASDGKNRIQKSQLVRVSSGSLSNPFTITNVAWN